MFFFSILSLSVFCFVDSGIINIFYSILNVHCVWQCERKSEGLKSKENPIVNSFWVKIEVTGKRRCWQITYGHCEY